MEETCNSKQGEHGIHLSDVSQVLEYWKAFALESRKASLDKTYIEMREMKTGSIQGRKRLNEATKTFRAKPKDEQLSGLNELLKCYQEEIDQLSRRSKLSEGSFLSLYKSIYEAPDPVDCIEGLLNEVLSGSTNELEIEKLKAELSQYDQEFQQLKNQDITIRRLEDQLQDYRHNNEDKIAFEITKRVSELEAEMLLKVQDYNEMQRTLEKRCSAAVEAMKQAQASTDRAQSQLFEVSTQAEARISALMSENVILAEGMQRLSLRLAETESELQNHKKQLPRSSGAVKSSGGLQGEADQEASLSGSVIDSDPKTLQLIISDLREEVRRSEESSRNEKHKLESSIKELTQQLAKERDLHQKTKQDLVDRPSKEDYVALKQQFRLVQKIAFNVNDNDFEDAHRSDPEHTLMDEKIQLELLLSSRLKTVESELVEARRDLLESKKQEINARESIANLKKSLESSSQLIARLEADLEAQYKVIAGQRTVRGRAEITDKRSEPNGLSDSGMPVGGTINDADLELSELLGVSTPDLVGMKAGNSDAHFNQMIKILQAQRDRYKDRLNLSENALIKQQQLLETAEAKIHQLEQDNLALYEKIRFLQAYSSANTETKVVTGMSSNTSSKMMKISHPERKFRRVEEAAIDDLEDDDEQMTVLDIENRYHSLYEQKLNPFTQFSNHEKQRKLRELSVADRIVLNTTLAIISNQTGRSVLMMYLAAMHLLVFITIYYSAHSVHYGCDPSIIEHFQPQRVYTYQNPSTSLPLPTPI